MIKKILYILTLFIISFVGAIIGWLSGLVYWLSLIPDSHLPSTLNVRIDTTVVTLLPLALLYWWKYHKNVYLLIASQAGVFLGPVTGYYLFPSGTMILETRLKQMFLNPWEYDIIFSIAFGGALGAFLLIMLVSSIVGYDQKSNIPQQLTPPQIEN